MRSQIIIIDHELVLRLSLLWNSDASHMWEEHPGTSLFGFGLGFVYFFKRILFNIMLHVLHNFFQTSLIDLIIPA